MNEPLRFTLFIIISTLVFLHAFIPLFQTVIPLWRLEHQSSKTLIMRILFRFGVLLLVIIQVMFSARALGFIDVEMSLARDVALYTWIVIALMIVASWITHPTGPRGL